MLLVVSVAVFMTAPDSSVVSVMNPRLRQSPHLSGTALPWVMYVYLLLLGGLLMTGGRRAVCPTE